MILEDLFFELAGRRGAAQILGIWKGPKSMNDREVYFCTTHYSGRVQGVGFRYHTSQIAREFEVSGTVRNLVDGRVFLDAEGMESQVKAFVREVDDRLGVFIRKTERVDGQRAAAYRGFRIS